MKEVTELQKKVDILKDELSLERGKYKKELIKLQEENKTLMFQNQNQEKEIKELKTRLSENATSIRNESDRDIKIGIPAFQNIRMFLCPVLWQIDS